MTPFITAAAGFLLAVLWFDLMFDVQLLRRGASPGEPPEEVLASIAGYYRRVTTDSRPMNLLVATAMLGLLGVLVVQLAQDDAPVWTATASLVLGAAAILVAGGHTFAAARRLGTRRDPPAVQSRLARSIFRDHLVCLVAIASLLAVQLGFAT
jgi:hypothetical protein